MTWMRPCSGWCCRPQYTIVPENAASPVEMHMTARYRLNRARLRRIVIGPQVAVPPLPSGSRHRPVCRGLVLSGAGVAEVLDAGLYQREDLVCGLFDGDGEYFGVEPAVRHVSEFVAQCDGTAVCLCHSAVRCLFEHFAEGEQCNRPGRGAAGRLISVSHRGRLSGP